MFFRFLPCFAITPRMSPALDIHWICPMLGDHIRLRSLSFGIDLIHLIVCLIFSLLGVFSIFPFLAQDNTIISDVSSGGSLEKTVNRSIEFYFGQHLSANEIWCAHNVFVVNLERNFLFKCFRNKKFYFKNHLTFQKLLILIFKKRATFSLFSQFWVLFGTNFFEFSEIKEI